MTLQPLSANLPGEEVAAICHAAGWSGNELIIIVAIAREESGWQYSRRGGPNKDGTYDWGLLQINDVHKPTALIKNDPLANAKYGYGLFKARGFQPWATFNSGKYKNSLGDAKSAVGKMVSNSPAWEKTVISKWGKKTDPMPTGDGANASLPSLPDPIGKAVAALNTQLQKISSNAAIVLLVILFLTIGIMLITRTSVGKAVADVTPIGGAIKTVSNAVSTRTYKGRHE